MCRRLIADGRDVVGLDNLSAGRLESLADAPEVIFEYAAVVTRFLVACLTRARPVIYGDGEQARDFAFIDDVVEANLLAARAPEEARGRAFNIGGGAEPTSVNRLLELIAASCGVEPEPVHKPERRGDIRRSEADMGLARTLLGFEPKVGIVDGLRRTVDWFRGRV